MKFSVTWLREFVDLPQKIEELVNLLTLAGVEIEDIVTRGANIDKVIVAQINASTRHPNADRLTLCQVDDGSKIARQIVCGATNYKVGDKVPLALPGAVLPKGLKVKTSKLRGVESEGMLCSATELGLGEDASGLLILSAEAKIGAPISDIFPIEIILDVEITPNRGDLLSHFGLAREIAALSRTALRDVHERFRETSLPELPKRIKISALSECPFYSARRIENVQVAPSPDWLCAKIESVGIRSINNIVDISNFVMLELGQPTHAFDADKLKGDIHVRLARDAEKFLALDGKTYSLRPRNLVIADDDKAVGIGGVMGGEESGVTAKTKNVILESAYFSPAGIRRTARELNLPSDASYRFERGVDPGMILRASQRASELIREIAKGTPAKEIATAGTLPADLADVSMRYEKCNQLLGITIAPKAIDQILERFGLEKKASKNKGTDTPEEETWKIPSYRRDLQRDVDLIEEVVRAHGVHQIAGTDRSRVTPSTKADRAHDEETQLRSTLAAHGLHEARTSKLISRNAPAFNENAIELRNPLSEDHVALRPSLLGGLLEVLVRNVRAGAERVAIFEIGRVFLPPQGTEERRIGILMWGHTASEIHWRANQQRRLDFFDLKGAVESVLDTAATFRRSQHPNLALAAEIISTNRLIGLLGQLSAAVAAKIDAPQGVFIAEVSADHVLQIAGSAVTFHEFGKFPAVTRDIAMIVPEELTHEEIMKEILRAQESLLEKVAFFDLFSGEGSGMQRGQKSVAYTLTYRDKNRTLTSEEVTAAHARIRERLRSEFGAELRE